MQFGAAGIVLHGCCRWSRRGQELEDAPFWPPLFSGGVACMQERRGDLEYLDGTRVGSIEVPRPGRILLATLCTRNYSALAFIE